MEKKDLYLSDEQIIELNKDRKIPMPCIITDEERMIVEASADYAVKKVIEELENRMLYHACNSISGWILLVEDVVALKKLIGA